MQRNRPITFSVIVPVYNVEYYLADCVRSVVEQAGPPDWECILVDDASTDYSGRICDELARLCPGVTVIHRPRNGGLAAARNTGIRAARGEWLLFLDSDDYWPAGMLGELRIALACNRGFDWYVGRYREVDASLMSNLPYDPRLERFEPGPCTDADYRVRAARLYDAGHWAVWRFCLRRSLLQRTGLTFWDEVRWAEDYPFDLVLLKLCPRMCFLDTVLVVYRANRAGSLLNTGLPRHFTGIAAANARFDALFADPAAGWTAEEQQEVRRRQAAVFWPQARAAASPDAGLRRACRPGLERCRALWDLPADGRRPDWVLFRLLLRRFGPRFALWAGSLFKRG